MQGGARGTAERVPQPGYERGRSGQTFRMRRAQAEPPRLSKSQPAKG